MNQKPKLQYGLTHYGSRVVGFKIEQEERDRFATVAKLADELKRIGHTGDTAWQMAVKQITGVTVTTKLHLAR